MLHISALNAAYPLAEVLAGKGYALRAMDQTPLAVLINHSLSTVNVVESAQGLDAAPDFPTALIQGSQSTNPLNECPHDLAMEEAVKMVTQAVSFNVDLARNTVVPIVKTVFEETRAYMDQNAVSTLSPLSVLPFYYRPIWDSPILHELVSRYAEMPLTDMALSALGLARPADFTEAALTGAGRFDEEIAAWIQSLDPAYVGQTWDSVFGASPVPTLGPLVSVPYMGADRALLVFLFARRLLSDVPEGVNMDRTAWSAYISTIVAQSGRAVMRVYEKRDLDRKFNNLIISSPRGSQANGSVEVVGDVYDSWLRAGGTPEVLFGAALAGGADRGYAVLLERAAEHRRTWERTYSLLQSRVGFERFNGFVEGMRQALSKAINALPDEQLIVDRGIVHQRLQVHMECLQQRDLEQMYHACRRLVCRVMYPHTDAEGVLEAIDASKAAHPQLNMREAALLAIVDYVAVWLTKLFTVEEASDYAR